VSLNRKELVAALVKKTKGVITPKEIVEHFREKGVEISEQYAAVLKSNVKRTLVAEGVSMKETKRRGRPPKAKVHVEEATPAGQTQPSPVVVKRRGRPPKSTETVKAAVAQTKKRDTYSEKVSKIAAKMTAIGEACDTEQKNAELVGRIFLVRSKLVESYDHQSVDAAWKRVSEESVS